MQSDKLSRRGFVGGLFTAVTTWLCPRPPRIAAAPIRPTPTAAVPPSADGYCTSYSYNGEVQGYTTYNYDSVDRLGCVTEHPPSASFTYESGYTYNYSAKG